MGNMKERDLLENQVVDGRISEWIFRKWDVGAWTGSNCLSNGTNVWHLSLR